LAIKAIYVGATQSTGVVSAGTSRARQIKE